MVESYRRQLEEAGRLDTPEGQTVLALAQRLADSGPVGFATLARELRLAHAKVMEEDVPPYQRRPGWRGPP
jgi:hypothetical protein